jgi:hypothetical protein
MCVQKNAELFKQHANQHRERVILKVRSFFEHPEIQENAIRELRAMRESAFQEAFQQWKKRWERCIASRGDYFEGDSA